MTQANKAFLAYLPVLHQGYIDWFTAHPDVKACFVLDVNGSSQLNYLRKDVRALEANEAQQILQASRFFEAVHVIPINEAARLKKYELYVPDDDVTAVLESTSLKDATMHKYPVFLRWHRNNVRAEQVVQDDETITYKAAPKQIRETIEHQAAQSTDWWRRVGAVLTSQDAVVLSGYNTHLPTAYTPYVDGDMRMNLNRGDGIELVGTQHAEASVLAEAASKGIKTSGLDMYVSTFPCPTCAKFIGHAGIARLYYEEGYALGNGVESLRAFGTKIIRITDAPASKKSDADRPYPEKD